MDRFEYMKLKLRNLPEDLVTLYNLVSKVDKNSFVYLKIRRGMYGLPQEVILAQQLLEKTVKQQRVHPRQSCPWSLDPFLEPNHFYPMCR